jgi:putative spermidine/putrescine transport system permease protein
MIATVLAVLGVAFLVAPMLVIVPMSFATTTSFAFPPTSFGLTYYRAYFASADWLTATWHSLLIAICAMLLTMAVAIPAAMAYVRHRFRGRGLVNLLLMAPLLIPHVVTALACYSYFSLLRINGTLLALVIAHCMLAIPISFLVLSATLKGFDRNLERAAMSSGAGPWHCFFLVTLPVLRPGILTAALFAFLSSFNEAVIAIFIAGRDSTTLPKMMYDSIRVEADPVLAVVSTLLVGAVLIGVLTFMGVRRRTAA